MDAVWQCISTALELSEEVSDKWLAILRTQYSESHRHYHTDGELIRRKGQHLRGASVCIQLAALFQYLYFEADKDCTVKNCEMVSEFFRDANIDNKTLETNVRRLLGDLEAGEGNLSEEDVQFFQDLDLLILGAPVDEYRQYTEQLRQENSTMDAGAYNKMRLKVLQAFNRIPFIYSTTNVSERYETAARANIQNEIKELESN